MPSSPRRRTISRLSSLWVRSSEKCSRSSTTRDVSESKIELVVEGASSRDGLVRDGGRLLEGRASGRAERRELRVDSSSLTRELLRLSLFRGERRERRADLSSTSLPSPSLFLDLQSSSKHPQVLVTSSPTVLNSPSTKSVIPLPVSRLPRLLLFAIARAPKLTPLLPPSSSAPSRCPSLP